MTGQRLKVYCEEKPASLLIEIENLEIITDIKSEFDLIIIFPETDVSELFTQLFILRKILCPIINVTGLPLDRADFKLDSLIESNWLTIEQQVLALVQRINVLPHISDSIDYASLVCLAFCATRDRNIEAKWAPDLHEMVSYPLLRGIDNARYHLEDLKSLGLLSAKAFDRLHICHECQSSRLNVREECNKCHSSHLTEQSLIHHYRCAYHGVSDEFEQENKLICPKCTKELRHYGVDYDRSGTILQCGDCAAVSSEPAIGFVCTDCGNHASADDIQVRNWSHYSLTPMGQTILRNGIMPKKAFSSAFEKLKGVYNNHDFIILTRYLRESALRYDRDLLGFRFVVENISQMREELGRSEFISVLSMLAEVISEIIRTTDALTVVGDDLFMLMPETNNEKVEIAFIRINEKVKGTISYPLELKYQPFEIKENIKEFLEVFK